VTGTSGQTSVVRRTTPVALAASPSESPNSKQAAACAFVCSRVRPHGARRGKARAAARRRFEKRLCDTARVRDTHEQKQGAKQGLAPFFRRFGFVHAVALSPEFGATLRAKETPQRATKGATEGCRALSLFPVHRYSDAAMHNCATGSTRGELGIETSIWGLASRRRGGAAEARSDTFRPLATGDDCPKWGRRAVAVSAPR
jgi:hypothetical protein